MSKEPRWIFPVCGLLWYVCVANSQYYMYSARKQNRGYLRCTINEERDVSDNVCQKVTARFCEYLERFMSALSLYGTEAQHDLSTSGNRQCVDC